MHTPLVLKCEKQKKQDKGSELTKEKVDKILWPSKPQQTCD